MKEKIPGVILFLSCHKHLNLRVGTFVPTEKEISGWKIHVVIGNPLIQEDYLIFDRLIIIKCEDSYIHLIKKLVLSYKILLEKYEIEQGIFRIGDDIEINKNNLIKFLEEPKTDYMGRCCADDQLGRVHRNSFMFDYFKNRFDELKNPLNGLSDAKISPELIPSCRYIAGVLVYTSKKVCSILINYMSSINYDVFYDTKTHGKPFTIEDVGVGFILHVNNINPTYRNDFYSDHEKNDSVIGRHTNLNR